MAMLLACGVNSAGWISLGAAEVAKTEAKPMPPRLLMIAPISLTTGETNRVTLRGLNLTNATSAKLVGPDGTAREAILQSRGPANPIDGFDPQRVGDQKLELDLFLDPSILSGTNNRIVIASSAGESQPFTLFAARPEEVVSEKEPNNSFRDASLAQSGMIIRGAIEAAGDVDVFQFEVEPGDKLRLEVMAERLGSTLDAALSLYDHTGNLLTQSDDTLGRDPRIEWTATKLEAVRIVISSVNEKAAASHQYLLKLESTKLAR
jgi:hypothetical protein